MTGYAQPQPLLALPWGRAPAHLPYGRSDLGGLEDDVPTALVAAGAGTLWLRYGQSGAVWLVDPARHRVAPVDLAAALPDGLRKAPIWCFAMAHDGADAMALLVGARAAGELRFSFRLLRFDPYGRPRDGGAPAPLYFGAEVPERLAVDAAGRCWVQAGKTLWIIARDGAPVTQLAATVGVLLDSGRFLTDSEPPRLLDPAGAPLGELARPMAAAGGRLLAAGPDDLVLFEQSAAGAEAPAQIGYLIARVGMPGSAPAILHRFQLPALRLRPDARGELVDGSPIRSWFPPGGMTFADNGDLLLSRITPEQFGVLRLAAQG